MTASQQPPDPRILAGRQTARLPEGVDLADWALERRQWQNPRIRTLLGTIHLLEGVLDSNYAILHCSPDRLQEVWRQVRKVAEVVRTQLAPLFERRSVVPAIEAVCKGTRTSLSLMSRELLSPLDVYPEDVPKHQLAELRKVLCVSIGQLSSFMQDTFGALMAADPRSTNDTDYYLSKRFPRDIEEAEWLYKSVLELGEFLEDLTREARRLLVPLIEHLERERKVLVGEEWQTAAGFVRRLDDLAERLREVLALRGIRFDEMEILDRHSRQIPESYNRLLELQTSASDVIAEMEGAAWSTRTIDPTQEAYVERCQAVFSRRQAEVARQLNAALADLSSFVPLWLVEIGNRRALMLYLNSAEAPSS